MVFDEKFLNAHLAKQADWAKQGKRSGSGRPFNIEGSRGVGAGGFTSNGKGSGRIKKKSKKKVRNPNENPHAIALAKLAANPVLRDGGEYRGRKINANHEHWEQVMLFDWLFRFQPEIYQDFTANPMGGLRDNKTASELYAEGVKSGYPDVTGDVVRGVYHGLRIELKWGKNKASDNQIIRMNRLTGLGYFCALCYGFEEARQVILEYIALQDGGVMTYSLNEAGWLGVAA